METESPEATEARRPPIKRERAGLSLARAESNGLLAEDQGVPEASSSTVKREVSGRVLLDQGDGADSWGVARGSLADIIAASQESYLREFWKVDFSKSFEAFYAQFIDHTLPSEIILTSSCGTTF